MMVEGKSKVKSKVHTDADKFGVTKNILEDVWDEKQAWSYKSLRSGNN